LKFYKDQYAKFWEQFAKFETIIKPILDSYFFYRVKHFALRISSHHILVNVI